MQFLCSLMPFVQFPLEGFALQGQNKLGAFPTQSRKYGQCIALIRYSIIFSPIVSFDACIFMLDLAVFVPIS